MVRNETMSDFQHLLERTEQLLASIDNGDWETYQQLCDPTLSAFEPEALGQLVEGMDFHQTYFTDRPAAGSRKSTIRSPHFRLLGETAVVAYVRLIQSVAATGQHATTAFEETRVWQRIDDNWKHVHFHRSKIGHLELG